MTIYHINQAGFAEEALFIASPNFDARPLTDSGKTADISLIVVHNISLPPGQYGGNGIIELFTNQLDPDEHPYYAQIHTFKVSAHFLIRRDGTLIQFVSCLDRAWHAGYQIGRGVNVVTISLSELSLKAVILEAFAPEQYQTLNNLIAGIRKAYPIQSIVGHSDIAPGRKTDPGPYFDWQQVIK